MNPTKRAFLRAGAVTIFFAMACLGACSNAVDDLIDASGDAAADQTLDSKPGFDTGTDVTTKDVSQDAIIDAIDESTDAPSDAADDAVDAPVDAPPDVTTSDGGVCVTNSDCLTTEFCNKAFGNCGGKGTCAAIPFICPLFVAPVCGCDKKTYINTCNANKGRESVAYLGACE